MAAAGSVDLKSLEAAGFKAGEKGGSDKDAAQREAMDEARRSILQGVLAPEARERLARVAIVKPDNARAVEEHLIRLARAGKIAAKITEDGLIRLLEEVTKAEASVKGATKVTITRRKRDEDDDDDDDDF